mgnify:CR=1 FL=1
MNLLYKLSAVVLFFCISCNNNGTADQKKTPAVVTQGQSEFSKIKLTELDGTPIDLTQYKGKAVFINFWATWCPPCVEELPMLDAFSREHTGKGFQVLALAIDQPSAVRRFLERQALGFPVGLAGLGGTELARSLGNETGSLPFSVFFAADGRVLAKKLGQLSREDLVGWFANAR